MRSGIALTFVFLITVTGSASAASSFKKTSGDRLLHVPSNVVFPARIGAFNRVGSHSYDTTGRDVSVRYVMDGTVLCDVYSYPVGPNRPNLSAEFDIQRSAIQSQNTHVKQISRDNPRLNQNGRAIVGVHANYELQRRLFDDRNRICGSQLYIFRDGPWFIAYRFSYPREKAAESLKSIADFLAAWQWRGSSGPVPANSRA